MHHVTPDSVLSPQDQNVSPEPQHEVVKGCRWGKLCRGPREHGQPFLCQDACLPQGPRSRAGTFPLPSGNLGKLTRGQAASGVWRLAPFSSGAETLRFELSRLRPQDASCGRQLGPRRDAFRVLMETSRRTKGHLLPLLKERAFSNSAISVPRSHTQTRGGFSPGTINTERLAALRPGSDAWSLRPTSPDQFKCQTGRAGCQLSSVSCSDLVSVYCKEVGV